MTSAKWKKRILALGLIAICLSIAATGTMAFFTAEDTSYNVIISGYVRLTLTVEDENGQTLPADAGIDVIPGTEVIRRVCVHNKGNVPVFVRVRVEQVLTAADSTKDSLDPDRITLALDENRWVESDGYYYYYRSLRPGEKSVPLFTAVQFSPQMGNEYMGAQLELALMGQAVQSANNGYDPLQALGWPMAPGALIKRME